MLQNRSPYINFEVVTYKYVLIAVFSFNTSLRHNGILTYLLGSVGSPSLPDLGVPSPVSGLGTALSATCISEVSHEIITVIQCDRGEGEAVYIFVAR